MDTAWSSLEASSLSALSTPGIVTIGKAVYNERSSVLIGAKPAPALDLGSLATNFVRHVGQVFSSLF